MDIFGLHGKIFLPPLIPANLTRQWKLCHPSDIWQTDIWQNWPVCCRRLIASDTKSAILHPQRRSERPLTGKVMRYGGW